MESNVEYQIGVLLSQAHSLALHVGDHTLAAQIKQLAKTNREIETGFAEELAVALRQARCSLRGIDTTIEREADRVMNLVDSSGWLEYFYDLPMIQEQGGSHRITIAPKDWAMA